MCYALFSSCCCFFPVALMQGWVKKKKQRRGEGRWKDRAKEDGKTGRRKMERQGEGRWKDRTKGDGKTGRRKMERQDEGRWMCGSTRRRRVDKAGCRSWTIENAEVRQKRMHGWGKRGFRSGAKEW